MEEFSEEAVKDAAGTLATVRMLLETVPMEMLEGVLKSSSDGRVRYQTLEPMLDPTSYQRHGANKELDFTTQIMAARALIDLKRAWQQDLPIAERIQEELDEGAPQDVEGEHADA